ncbi:MAG: capsule assembly Wzi family protein [Chitinivibrionia bacterium]|nr:capsule assembly Wzi family protein [Chitinivibrionia bacterium]
MKNSLIILAFLTTFSFAKPIVLEENIHRNADKDSVFNLRFKSDSEFWQANNFNFRVKIINNKRIIMYIGDSIGYKPIDFIFSGFFDNQAIHGKTADWSKLEDRGDNATQKITDLYRLILKFTPNDKILISIGKDYYNWGPAQIGGLMLSDYNMGFTGLYQQYKIGGFTIRGLATQLNGSPWQTWEQSANAEPSHRFFSAGRIEYYRDLWGFAVSQSIIYGGLDRSFEIPYLIPVFPFHYAQLANWRYGNNGDNTFGGLDAYANVFDKKVQIYGELLVDDIQGDSDELSQSVQNHIGFIVGSKFNIPKITYGFFEAGQINSFVYNHSSGYSMKYLNKNAFIGSPLGPDNQLFWGKIGYDFSNINSKINLKTEIYGWLLRQGERNINFDYENSYQFGTRKDEIPYGKVRREIAAWLSAIYEYKHNTAEIYGGVSKTQTENVSGTSKITPFFGFFVNAAIGIGWFKDDK